MIVNERNPHQDAYRDKMNRLAASLDRILNGEATGTDRKTGFCLLVFPFDTKLMGRGKVNYSSNVPNRDMVNALDDLLARWKATDVEPDPKG